MVEIPRASEKLIRGLKEFDPRVTVHWNSSRGLWEVRELLQKTGEWSHCFFWAGGDWRRRTFRPLPQTADPLIQKLAEIDCAKYGNSGRRMMAEFRARSSAKRAQMLDRSRSDLKRRVTEYARYMGRNWDKMRRRYNMGGASRKAAIREREDLYRDVADGE